MPLSAQLSIVHCMRDWQPERTHPTAATATCATYHTSKLRPQLTHNISQW